MKQCGSCTLCCRLVPIPTLHKKAGQRCQHQRSFKGCAIYARRPMDCRLWSCRWLVEDDTQDLARPDRSHLVIDMMPDFITAQQHEGSPQQVIEVVQVWIDPAHPEAMDDPAFRAYLARRGEEGRAAIIRFDEHKAIVCIPPAMSNSHEWIFCEDNLTLEDPHTFTQIANSLANA